MESKLEEPPKELNKESVLLLDKRELLLLMGLVPLIMG
jgi:hypothetical protein